jgi:hypothetical protein
MYIYTHTCIYIYTHMCVCVCVCMHIYIISKAGARHIYIYILQGMPLCTISKAGVNTCRGGCSTRKLFVFYSCYIYSIIYMYSVLVEHAPPPYAQRLGWVSGHHMTRKQHASLSPGPQSTHAVAPVTGEYLPAQQRHASVQHPPPRCGSRKQRPCIEDTHLE